MSKVQKKKEEQYRQLLKPRWQREVEVGEVLFRGNAKKVGMLTFRLPLSAFRVQR